MNIKQKIEDFFKGNKVILSDPKLNYFSKIITANRKMLKNSNGFVLGRSGSGKVYNRIRPISYQKTHRILNTKKLFKKRFKNSEEYVSYIAPRLFKKRLKKIHKTQNNTFYYIDDELMDTSSFLHHAILFGYIDIIDVPQNIRLEKHVCFITAMRVSHYDFRKRLKYLKLYRNDLTRFDENKSDYNKHNWYDTFAGYTSEALKQCIVGRSDITEELRNDFMDFLFNLPQEIRNLI